MPDAEARKPVTLSREELYAQARTTPISRLAGQYGLSGNGLAKICARLHVPYPPRGHWARKVAGKKVTEVPLPTIRPGTPAQVTITPTLPAPTPPQTPPELLEALAAARRLTAGLKVRGKLTHPHRVVAGWIDERRRWREQQNSFPRTAANTFRLTSCRWSAAGTAS